MHACPLEAHDMSGQAEHKAVAYALATYLYANPYACDTAEAIGRWWFAAAPVPLETLLLVLEWMKREGLMEELTATDGRLRYRRRATDAQLQVVIVRLQSDGAVH